MQVYPSVSLVNIVWFGVLLSQGMPARNMVTYFYIVLLYFFFIVVASEHSLSLLEVVYQVVADGHKDIVI